jgi:hypothetical protein
MDWGGCVRNGIATLKCVPIVFNNLISALLAFSGVVAVVLIVLGGIQFLTSGGDPIKVEKARKTIMFAVIGFALVLLSFVIMKVVSTITGVQCQVFGLKC